MYTLDTNTIIYYSKNDPQVVKILDAVFEKQVSLYLSAISEIELFGFPKISNDEIIQIEQFLSAVVILPLDSRIARIAGSLRQQYGLKVPDSAIAATALLTGSTLITRNVRDFKKIEKLSILEI